MRKRRTRYSERNTRYHSRKGQTFQQIILSIVALFLVVIFLVVGSLIVEFLFVEFVSFAESFVVSF